MVLIIEDNNEINELLCDILKKDGFETQPAYSGTEGLLYFHSSEYELILLDLMLPGISGNEVLREIRAKSTIPVIIISAKDDMDEKVQLLEHGANDYIAKPFDVREVLARVHLQLKRSTQPDASLSESTITYRELTILPEERSVLIGDQCLNLTRHEYNILFQLYSNPKKVFTKQELFELAWEEFYIGDDKTLNVHISNIRNKIKAYSEDTYIETVWGIGFKAPYERNA